MRHQTIISIIACLLIAPWAITAEGEEIADAEVSDAVEDRLILDTTINANNIDVATAKSIVTLTGQATNLLAKDRATLIAKMVKGVRGVSNRIDVEPLLHRTDFDIRNDVIMSLVENPATESYDVSVSVDDGVVTLTGTVQSWQEKEMCIRTAKGVKGVEAVESDIKIDYPEERADKEIKAEIEKRLSWDILVNDGLITVTVDDGAIDLGGTVGSDAERDRVRRLAWVVGTESVDTTDIEIRWWAADEDLRKDPNPSKSDAKLKAAIEDALLYDPRVYSFQIAVAVDGGLVTLRGNVDNLKAKMVAEQLAQNVVGTLAVTNRIKVRSELVYDSEIAEDVQSALLRNPYTESYEVQVTVKDGVVTLEGTVDSYFEKAEAADVASSVTGVSTVINRINVLNEAVGYRYDPYLEPYDPMIEDDTLYTTATPLRPDSEIAEDIEDEMYWSPFVDGEDVTVTVSNGVATLTGTVQSWSEYNAATDNAYDGGAVLVDNDLEVK